MEVLRRATISECPDFSGLGRDDASRLLTLWSMARARTVHPSTILRPGVNHDAATAWSVVADAPARVLPRASGVASESGDDAASRCLSPRDDNPTLPHADDRNAGRLPCLKRHHRRQRHIAHATGNLAPQNTAMPAVAHEACALIGDLAPISWPETRNKELAAMPGLARRDEDMCSPGADADALSAAPDGGAPACHRCRKVPRGSRWGEVAEPVSAGSFAVIAQSDRRNARQEYVRRNASGSGRMVGKGSLQDPSPVEPLERSFQQTSAWGA